MKKMMKRIFALLLVTALLIPTTFASPTMTVYANAYGDLNGNGQVEAVDALIVLKHVVKLETLTADLEPAADVDLNNKVEAVDALYILKYVVHLIPQLPIGGPVITPADNLQTIKEFVLANGEVNEYGIYYVYEAYESQEDTTIFQQVVEIAYEKATDDLVFGNTVISFDTATSEYYVDVVQMRSDGSNGSAVYILSSLDDQGNLVENGVLGTAFLNAQVTGDSAFAYETLFPEGTDLAAEGWNEVADANIQFAFEGWNVLLSNQLEMTLGDIGFQNYK